MKKITTKYLRQNLKEIIDHVNDVGEEYMVYYRSKPAFKLVPERDEEEFESERRRQERIKFFKKLERFKLTDQLNHPDDDKKIYRKRLLEKYGKGIS